MKFAIRKFGELEGVVVDSFDLESRKGIVHVIPPVSILHIANHEETVVITVDRDVVVEHGDALDWDDIIVRGVTNEADSLR